MNPLSEPIDHEVLAAVFASAVRTVKKSKEEVVAEAVSEWEHLQVWLCSNTRGEQSFLWYCDEFDLDPAVVRKAIKEKLK